MNAATLVGIGGVAMMAVWAWTPEVRSMAEKPDEDRHDDLETVQDAMEYTEEFVPPSQFNNLTSSPQIAGTAPSWFYPVANQDPRPWESHESAGARRTVRHAALGNSTRTGKRNRATPHRGQACFDSYRPLNYRVHPKGTIENAF